MRHLTKVAPQRYDTLLCQAEQSTCMRIVVGCIQSDGCVIRCQPFADLDEERGVPMSTGFVAIKDETLVGLLCIFGVM